MKKSLFAIAAVTAFAGAAQAQSSVTVYGLLDVGYVGSSERETALGTTSKATTNAFSQSAQSTSRLGFRGREDLGGGTAAFFTIEMGITPNSTAATGGVFTNTRNAFVGLSQKGIGSASIGTQNTVIFNALGRTDPGQLNNIGGNVLTGGSTGAIGSNEDGNSFSYTQRLSNMLQVQSEVVAGFQGTAYYQLLNQNSTQTATNATGAGGTVNTNGYGIGVNYTWQKLLLSANYQSAKAENNTLVRSTVPVSVSATGTLSMTNGTDTQMYFGGVYDFGILKAYAGYLDRKLTSGFNSNDTLQRSAQQIGVRGNWTPKIESWASIGNGKVTASGAVSSAVTANFNGWQLGSNYILSKRTNLYAIYGQELTSASTVNTSYALSNYAIGVRHTF
jgi:predicted porin